MTALLQQSEVVAVTGARGFIGKALVQRLTSAGHPVVALSRSNVDAQVGTPGVPAVTHLGTDYQDPTQLASVLRGVKVVFHLAARAHHLDEDPQQQNALYRQANVDITRHLAQAARQAGVRRVVFISSIGVNGDRTVGTPFRADDQPKPGSPYARSKLEAEQQLQTILGTGMTDFVIVRPPLVYGPGCPGNFERLMRLVQRAPIVPLGGLKAPRSFVFLDNLLSALELSARHPAAGRRTFLVCDGRDVSVSEVVFSLAEVFGRSARVWSVPAWALESLARLAGRQAAYRKLAEPLQIDGRPLQETLNWHPPVDPREGLRLTALAWLSGAH